MFATSLETYENQSVAAVQQARKITGTLTDAVGEPIIGATVLEKGNPSNGTITDINGKFSLSVHPNAVISISYIGYITQNIKITNQTSLKVVMMDDTQALEEVVVVGYGSQKKANLTGAVSSVKMDEVLGDRPILNASDALQGAVPGLFVSNGGNAPGTSKSFQIRGAYSVGVKNSDGSYGNTIKPLVLIDNVEGDLDMVNPEDIESISVLKDAASAAIYGARAAGGVIVVTTKRPKGAAKFSLNYNNNFAFGTAVNLPKQAPLMDYLQAYLDCGYSDAYWSLGSPSVSKWMEYLSEYQKNPSAFNTVGDGIYMDESGVPYYLNEKDLYKNFMETSFQMTHNISASGGTDKLRYRISGGYTSNDGVLVSDRDKFERMNINTFISADVTNWFTQEVTMSYAHSLQTSPGGMGGVYNTRLVSYYPEGDLPASVNTLANEDLPLFTPRNQILLSNPVNNNNDNPRIFLKSILKPLKGLEAVFEYTFDKNIYDYHWYTGQYDYTTIQGGSSKSFVDDYLRKYKQHTNYNAINVYATYSKKFGDHNFKVMAGFNQESSYQETLDAYSYNQAVIDVPAMGSGTGTIKATDSYSEYAVRGGFFRVNYNYQDKYLLEVNGRYDGSSKFPKSSRFGFFPSVSVGWNIARENFMKPVAGDWLSDLKLRGTWGQIGNQGIDPYKFVPPMSQVEKKDVAWLVNGAKPLTLNAPGLVSDSFTWETVETLDFGFDITALNGRLQSTFDWYRRDTKDMLAPGAELPSVVGASAPLQNTADLRTKGWELSLTWRDRIGAWGYNVGFNLYDSKTVVTKYHNESKIILKSDGTNNYYEGYEIGSIWGYVTDGYYTADDFEDTNTWKLKEGVVTVDGVSPRPGDIKYQNLRDDGSSTNRIDTGDGTFDNPGDRKIIGNNSLRLQYCINLGVNYKGFDLSVLLQGVGKRDVWISDARRWPFNSGQFGSLFKDQLDYWKPVDSANGDWTAANPNAEYFRIYGQGNNSSYNTRAQTMYLMIGSYLRVKNVTLSYNFPMSWLAPITLTSLKAFVSCENLHTFTKLMKGYDPERLSWGYPFYRTISFGFNVTL